MAPKPSFTLGIEEEFQVIDPNTRELAIEASRETVNCGSIDE